MFYFRKKFFQLKRYAVRYWKHLLLTGAVFFCIVFNISLFESFLDSGSTDMWDQSLKNEDTRILKSHSQNAFKHPFRFNDHPYPEKKERSCFRMIVLGDSVIFGDGLPLEQIWSRKLEKTLKQKYPVEVLHWGQCGWSTLDQLNFLKRNFSDKGNIFDADLLLISWFGNDPDMGTVYYNSHRKLLSNPLFIVFTSIFPKLGAILYEFNEGREYDKIRSQLYSDENLCRYQKVLHDLKLFCQEKKTDLFFVILSSGDDNSTFEFDKIETLLQKESIPTINLHPLIVEQVEDVPYKELNASPVNKHPGSILTTLYARYTCLELVKKYGTKMCEKGENDEGADLRGL